MVKNLKILKIIKKSLFSKKYDNFKLFFLQKKILLVFQYYEDAIQPELSSTYHFRIQGWGGYPERDEGQRTENLVSNFGYE